MEPFVSHNGIVATLKRANVDTDAIIPKEFLKSIHRTGYGPSCFQDWRYLSDGSPNPAFELNAPRFKNRSILVTGNNFGCGSSREHAVWALTQDGYKVIIAPWTRLGGERLPGFADIFRGNAAKNGLLTIELDSDAVQQIFDLVENSVELTANVDLAEQTVTFNSHPQALTFGFEIDPGPKEQLLKGLDDIDLTMQHEDRIARFEKRHNTYIG